MQKIIWDKRYNIDNGIIDKQHQYLVKLINLIADETEYITTEAVKAIFVELIHYANIRVREEGGILMKTD